MEKRVIKLGVAGLLRGKDVVASVMQDENVILRAICDKNEEVLEKARTFFAEEKKARDLLCFDNLEALLESDIDAVYIATDAPSHTKHVKMALEAGKHVISEIPAVYTLEEAKELKEAVEAHPELKYMAGENCFYWAFIESWKRMYEDGKFGEVVYAESEYLHAIEPCEIKEENYRGNHWRKSLNAIRYLTHNLGPLLYIMDDRCVSVTCMEPEVRYNPYKTGAENGVALFKTAKGAVIRILICFGAYVGFDHNFRILGTKGSIETDNTKKLGAAHSLARFEEIPGSFEEKIDIPVTTKFPGEADSGHGGADGKMMRAFVDCIINDKKPPIDVDMGIRISLPGILAHESAANGGMAIEIPETF